MAAVVPEARTFTKGDTRVSLAFTLQKKSDQSAIDLTSGVCELKMIKTQDGTVKIDYALCVIEDAASGVGRYDWLQTDVNTTGTYNVWVRFTKAGKSEHFPGHGKFFQVVIVDLTG